MSFITVSRFEKLLNSKSFLYCFVAMIFAALLILNIIYQAPQAEAQDRKETQIAKTASNTSVLNEKYAKPGLRPVSEVSVSGVDESPSQPLKLVMNENRNSVRIPKAQSSAVQEAVAVDNDIDPVHRELNQHLYINQELKTDAMIKVSAVHSGIRFEQVNTLPSARLTIVGGPDEDRIGEELTGYGSSKSYNLEDGVYRWEVRSVDLGEQASQGNFSSSEMPSTGIMQVERGRFEIRNGLIVPEAEVEAEEHREDG